MIPASKPAQSDRGRRFDEARMPVARCHINPALALPRLFDHFNEAIMLLR